MCLLRGTDWVFIYNSTFCSHSVFMCFVWISEQTAIISLFSIKWLVFITETECVYCVVQAGSLLDVFSKLRKATVSFVMSVRLHGTTRLPPDGVSWNFKFEYFSKICRENSRLIETCQEQQVLYMKTNINFLIMSRPVLHRMRSVSYRCR